LEELIYLRVNSAIQIPKHALPDEREQGRERKASGASLLPLTRTRIREKPETRSPVPLRFLYHNRTTREKTVEKYIEMEPCSEGTHLQIYLFEDTAFEAANVVEHLDDEVSSQAAALAAGARAE
jgi:hypothetical protein